MAQTGKVLAEKSIGSVTPATSKGGDPSLHKTASLPSKPDAVGDFGKAVDVVKRSGERRNNPSSAASSAGERSHPPPEPNPALPASTAPSLSRLKSDADKVHAGTFNRAQAALEQGFSNTGLLPPSLFPTTAQVNSVKERVKAETHSTAPDDPYGRLVDAAPAFTQEALVAEIKTAQGYADTRSALDRVASSQHGYDWLDNRAQRARAWFDEQVSKHDIGDKTYVELNRATPINGRLAAENELLARLNPEFGGRSDGTGSAVPPAGLEGISRGVRSYSPFGPLQYLIDLF